MENDLTALLLSSLAGDDVATGALMDLTEEYNVNLHPFEVEKCYFIEQQTFFYVGRVVRVGPCWIELEDCSWVHWTGRKSTLLRAMSFDHTHFPDGDRKPRTEYEGQKFIFTASTSAANLWTGKLHKESIA